MTLNSTSIRSVGNVVAALVTLAIAGWLGSQLRTLPEDTSDLIKFADEDAPAEVSPTVAPVRVDQKVSPLGTDSRNATAGASYVLLANTNTPLRNVGLIVSIDHDDLGKSL